MLRDDRGVHHATRHQSPHHTSASLSLHHTCWHGSCAKCPALALCGTPTPLSTFQRLLQDAQHAQAESFTALARPLNRALSPASRAPRAPSPSHSFCPAQHDAMLHFARANQVVISEEFLAAWLSDHAQLTPFEQTSGEVGIEECFAETGARIHGGCPTVRRERPALSAYFDRLDTSQIDLT